MKPYFYQAKVLSVVDGDTIDVELDLGFNTFTKQRLRLLGFNTPERGQPGFELATTYLKNHLANHQNSLLVNTTKRDSFGRWLAHLYGKDGFDINADMAAFCRDVLLTK